MEEEKEGRGRIRIIYGNMQTIGRWTIKNRDDDTRSHILWGMGMRFSLGESSAAAALGIYSCTGRKELIENIKKKELFWREKEDLSAHKQMDKWFRGFCSRQ